MLRQLEFVVGLALFIGAIWDGFATIVLPRTLLWAPLLSHRFNRLSWRLWALLARGVTRPNTRLSVLAIYGPLSVMFLLALWGAAVIIGFALVYHGLGARFHATSGSIGFGTLLYMSGSTFLTLGLGDVTSPDPLARSLILLEAAAGYIFLAMIITYMPLLDQAYGAREAGNLLIHSRAGCPPTAISLLRHYLAAEHADLLRSNLREGERWLAETLQSHLAHPVLSFYRAHRVGESWLISVTILLDLCAIVIAAGDGLPAAQARLTYRIGVRLARELVRALRLRPDRRAGRRLNVADLPSIQASIETADGRFALDRTAMKRLVRLARRYDLYVSALAGHMLVPLPPWLPHHGLLAGEKQRPARGAEGVA